ncbi:hypothetical protein [Synechococcus sp. PCC 7336]|uniref:hypothetical protein n=1 Tax=Synechococcus sp. PCC 7336 TaxID=195250 RepID=UPI0012EABC69|nr:hypothetical protein [Synechococcus sp. PCC 7336]
MVDATLEATHLVDFQQNLGNDRQVHSHTGSLGLGAIAKSLSPMQLRNVRIQKAFLKYCKRCCAPSIEVADIACQTI